VSDRPDPQGVDALLQIAERVLDDERERGRILDSKTAQFAAFSGTILTLDVTLGESVLPSTTGS
jgi:hypothetical protein